MKLDMNKVWSHGIRLVAENFQLLAVIAGLFLLLPSVALYFLIPGMDALMDPNADPEIVQERILEVIGPVMTYGIAGSIVQFVGYCAMVALMGANRPTVGEALATGFKSVLSVIGALIIFLVLYMLASVVIVTPIAILGNLAASGIIAAISPILILGVAIFLMARFSLTMPVIVVDGVRNPFRAVKRSWDLTSPSKWGVLAFWLILVIVYIVISLLVLGVFGVVAALAGTGTGATLVLGLANGAVGMFVGMILCALAVAMHKQLAGPSEAEITSTFD